MSDPERGQALILAAIILDKPNADPDSDIAVLARQLNRAQEQLDTAAAFLDGLADMLDSLPRWTEECGCYTPTRMAAADCRAMAKKLRGET